MRFILLIALASMLTTSCDQVDGSERHRVLIDGQSYIPIRIRQLPATALGDGLAAGRYVCDCLVVDVNGEQYVHIVDAGTSSFEQALLLATYGADPEVWRRVRQGYIDNHCDVFSKCRAIVLLSYDGRPFGEGGGLKVERVIYRGTSQGVVEQIVRDMGELAE